MHTPTWKGFVLFCILTLVCIPVQNTYAQSAAIDFSTNLTYQNVGNLAAHPTILYQPADSSSAISISRPELAIGASATISAGSLETSEATTQGSAIVKSDVPLALLMTQVSTSSSLKAIAISAGASTGTQELWFLNPQMGTAPSKLAVQNVDAVNNQIKFKFVNGNISQELTYENIKPGKSVLLNLAELTQLNSDSYQAIQVTSTRSSDSGAGKIIGTHWIASATENTSIEGVHQKGKKIFMPIAMCQTTAGMSTSYFVFNTDPTTTTSVKVTYSSGKYESKSIAANTGAWFNACNPSGTSTGYNGSGIITSGSTAVIATGLIKNGGVKTSFIGQTSGVNKLAIPYAVYSASQYTTRVRQRTSLQIMNLGGALSSGQVKVQYFNKNGKLIGTHALGSMASGTRKTSSPASIGTAGQEFGYYSDGSSGGSAIIVAPQGSKLMATVWVSSMTAQNTYTGEVYNAIPVVQ